MLLETYTHNGMTLKCFGELTLNTNYLQPHPGQAHVYVWSTIQMQAWTTPHFIPKASISRCYTIRPPCKDKVCKTFSENHICDPCLILGGVQQQDKIKTSTFLTYGLARKTKCSKRTWAHRPTTSHRSRNNAWQETAQKEPSQKGHDTGSENNWSSKALATNDEPHARVGCARTWWESKHRSPPQSKHQSKPPNKAALNSLFKRLLHALSLASSLSRASAKGHGARPQTDQVSTKDNLVWMCAGCGLFLLLFDFSSATHEKKSWQIHPLQTCHLVASECTG